jgi:hypothetical protein
MTSIPDSVKATLDAGWTGAGGAEPTYYVSEDFRTDPPLGKDGIWIPTGTLKTKIVPVNDTYSNKLHTLDVIVNTQTDEDRLKEIADEVERILNATAITGATYQKVIDRKSNVGQYKGIWVYQEIITVDIREQLASSASAYGAGTTGDFAVVGNLTVGGTAVITGALTADDVTTVDDVIVGDDIDLNTGGKIIFDIDADANNQIYAAAENQINVIVEGIETFRIFGSQISARVPFHPNGNKAISSGVTGTSVWDNIYADDFVNESPYQKFDDALADLKKIKEKDNKIDYASLPEWVCTIEKKKDKDGNPTGEKTEKNTQGFSVNRMVVFLWQALQQALTRIEELEKK